MCRVLPILVGVVLCTVATARADIPPTPPWEPRDPGNWMALFVGLLLAVVARLALLGLRNAASRFGANRATPACRQFGPGSVLFLATFTLAFYAYWHVQQQLARREYVRGRSRIYEPKSNLGAIRSTEVAYFAEWNVFVGNQPLTPPRGPRDSGRRVPWVPTTRFSVLGFAPEGDVYCSYSLSGGDWPTGTEGFTATAACDYDDPRGLRVYTMNHTSNEVSVEYLIRR